MLSSHTGIIATIMMAIGMALSSGAAFMASIEENAVFWGLAISAAIGFCGVCIKAAQLLEQRRHNRADEKQENPKP